MNLDNWNPKSNQIGFIGQNKKRTGLIEGKSKQIIPH
jgi:hypothetical protein